MDMHLQNFDVLHHITESIVPYRVQRIVRKVIVTSKMEPVWAVFQGILDQDVKKRVLITSMVWSVALRVVNV